MSGDEGISNIGINKSIITKYRKLPLPGGKALATYVWVDGTGESLRSKDRVLDNVTEFPVPIDKLPVWNFDGSSTGQAHGEDSDVFLYPRAIYRDPFRLGNHILVMCDTYVHSGEATATNLRKRCQEAHDLSKIQEPWFAIEQEYLLMDKSSKPLGWPKSGPTPGIYYCGVGANSAVARDLVEAHLICCLYAGVPICGTNAEVLLAQWEYQVGPSLGVAAGDDLWMSRYILQRLGEEYDIVISFDPKPLKDWNGSGAHTNFSTRKMRDSNGITEIRKAIEKLSKVHREHIRVYDPHGGKDNAKRLTGLHETASINDFSSGVANRGCSIRIPRSVAEEEKGYLEDRRPASNCDPYAVIDAILRTVCINN